MNWREFALPARDYSSLPGVGHFGPRLNVSAYSGTSERRSGYPRNPRLYPFPIMSFDASGAAGTVTDRYSLLT